LEFTFSELICAAFFFLLDFDYGVASKAHKFYLLSALFLMPDFLFGYLQFKTSMILCFLI